MSSQVIWKQTWNSEAESTLEQALTSQSCSIKELSSQQWDPKTSTIGGVRDYMTSYVSPASPAWSSVILHLNSFIGEPIAADLSRIANGPSIVLLEYDQAAWGYTLFEGGKLLNRFWNIPERVETPPEECRGDVASLCSVFGVRPEAIAPYVRHVAPADNEAKAFPEDEFTIGDHWVRVDFLKRLGLNYPSLGNTAGGRHIKIEEPRR